MVCVRKGVRVNPIAGSARRFAAWVGKNAGIFAAKLNQNGRSTGDRRFAAFSILHHHDGPTVIQFHQILDAFSRVNSAFRQVTGTGADDRTDEGGPA